MQNSLSWSTLNLFGLGLDLFTVSIKALRTILPIFIFEMFNSYMLVTTSMTHNKYLAFSYLENNDPIPAKSAAKILSLNLA